MSKYEQQLTSNWHGSSIYTVIFLTWLTLVKDYLPFCDKPCNRTEVLALNKFLRSILF